MKFNLTFQTLRTIKATMAISFAVYGAWSWSQGTAEPITDGAQLRLL